MGAGPADEVGDLLTPVDPCVPNGQNGRNGVHGRTRTTGERGGGREGERSVKVEKINNYSRKIKNVVYP